MKQKLQLITDLSLDKAMTIARQHEQVKLQIREQQLEQHQRVAEARVSPSPRTVCDVTNRSPNECYARLHPRGVQS